MKARGTFVSLTFILTCALMFLSGCSGGGDDFVSTPLSSEKEISAYSLNGVAGTINESEKTIAVAMPVLTNVTSLVATFTTTGVSVTVGTTSQASGVTANNFITPAAYIITAADGTTATYTITVTVNRTWHNPTSLSDNISPDGRDAYPPQVAMDNKGNAIIVWKQSDESGYTQIFKSEYRNGIWYHPANLSDHISPDGANENGVIPQIAMDNNGNAIIVWHQIARDQYGNYPYHIFKSEYRNGTWIHPVSLSDHISPEGGSARMPNVAMDNNGNAIIVWQQFNGAYDQIFKSEYRNGAWHHPASLTDNISPDGQDADSVQVAMDNNGNAIIVWQESDGTNDQVFKSEYRNGIWYHPANLADNISPDGQGYYCPQVAMDNNGNAIIVWCQSDGSNNYQIFKSEYGNGTWHNPANLDDNISPDGQGAVYPQVAMDNNGNAIIVWRQYDGTNYHIFKSEYRNSVWHNPANLADNISLDSEGYYDPPAVAMDNNGNAIIVWQQSDGTNYQIFKSEYR